MNPSLGFYKGRVAFFYAGIYDFGMEVVERIQNIFLEKIIIEDKE